jgi:hypothetical protein
MLEPTRVLMRPLAVAAPLSRKYRNPLRTHKSHWSSTSPSGDASVLHVLDSLAAEGASSF